MRFTRLSLLLLLWCVGCGGSTGDVAGPAGGRGGEAPAVELDCVEVASPAQGAHCGPSCDVSLARQLECPVVAYDGGFALRGANAGVASTFVRSDDLVFRTAMVELPETGDPTTTHLPDARLGGASYTSDGTFAAFGQPLDSPDGLVMFTKDSQQSVPNTTDQLAVASVADDNDVRWLLTDGFHPALLQGPDWTSVALDGHPLTLRLDTDKRPFGIRKTPNGAVVLFRAGMPDDVITHSSSEIYDVSAASTATSAVVLLEQSESVALARKGASTWVTESLPYPAWTTTSSDCPTPYVGPCGGMTTCVTKSEGARGAAAVTASSDGRFIVSWIETHGDVTYQLRDVETGCEENVMEDRSTSELVISEIDPAPSGAITPLGRVPLGQVPYAGVELELEGNVLRVLTLSERQTSLTDNTMVIGRMRVDLAR